MQIKRSIHKMGDDTVILVQGGAGHIGAQVVACPYQKNKEWHVTCSSWNQLGHKDDIVAQQYAKALCHITHHIVTCICGIHIDDIEEHQIQEILDWVRQDIQKMEKEYTNHE